MTVSARGLACWVLLAVSVPATVHGGDEALVRAVRDGDVARTRALIAQQVDVNAAAADGATALHWAAYASDLETLQLLLRGQAKVNVANVYGVTPLALGCVNANAPVVVALLKAGADPNLASSSGETPLMTAARTGDVAVVKALLGAGAAVTAHQATGQTALMWAAAEGHGAIVQELIKAGAAVDGRTDGKWTPLMFAGRSGDVESARALLSAGAKLMDTAADKSTALIIAAGSGHTALVSFLLDQGADPNMADANGMTPLHAAVWGNFNNVAMIQRLLAGHANPNAQTTRDMRQRITYKFYGDIQFRTAASLQGATPFALAAAQGDVAAMRALAAGGANPTLALDNGSTPLALAAGLGWAFEQSLMTPERALAAVEVATELGGDVNVKNKGGRTALHGAANQGVEGVLRFLVAKGADINALDGDGRTPLWTAEHAQLGASVLPQPASIKVLRELGAKDITPVVAKTP